MKFNGSIVALITPFVDGKLDLVAFERLLKWHDTASDALVVTGSTGEGPLLSLEEKVTLWQLAKKYTDIPVIAGCFGLDYSTIFPQVDAAKDVGVDGILLTPPPYLKLTQSSITTFYETIADRTSEQCPLILYNIPTRCGVEIAIDTVIALAHHPKITAIKESTWDMVRCQQLRLALPDFGILVGEDNLVGAFLAHGANGWINVVGNVAPHQCREIMSLWNQSNISGFSQSYAKLYPLITKLMGGGPNPLPIKASVHQLFTDINNEVRPPLIAIDFMVDEALWGSVVRKL